LIVFDSLIVFSKLPSLAVRRGPSRLWGGQMRAQRIKTGFHRAGIALATLVVVLGFLILWNPRAGPDEAMSILIMAAIAYGVMWGLGWAIAGFVGDGEKN
jgi:hypothetical protein